VTSGAGILLLARQHIGEQYENVLVPENNPNWHGPRETVLSLRPGGYSKIRRFLYAHALLSL